MTEVPKKKPRRKLLQVAALTTGAIVGAGLAASGCSSTTTTDDAAADTADEFTVGRPAQDASTPDTPPPGIIIADAGTSVLDAESE